MQSEKQNLELKQARDVKNHKEGFIRFVINKQKQKGNTGPLLHRRGELVTDNTLKAQGFLHLSVPPLLGPRPWEQKSRFM